jgi:RNA polymerase sigma-70 factor, ECF subfamily
VHVIDLDDFVARDYERVVRAVALATGDVDGARDAVQEALAKAIENDNRGGEIERPAAWITAVALNSMRRRWRRTARETEVLGLFAASSNGAVGDLEMAFDVYRALVTLPGRQCQSVVLHHLLDLDVATTARYLKVSEGTVKTALSHGRAALAVSLRPAVATAMEET